MTGGDGLFFIIAEQDNGKIFVNEKELVEKFLLSEIILILMKP